MSESERPNYVERTREKIPFLIQVIGYGLILSPLLNMVFNSLYLGVPLNRILFRYDSLGVVILHLAPVAGAGILTLQSWGYFVFIVYAITVIAYNILMLVRSTDWYNGMILIQSLIFLSLAAFFLGKDRSKPYLSRGKRGFRRSKRHNVVHEVIIGGKRFRTINVSETGMLLAWTDCELAPGAEVYVELPNEGESFPAGIVRVGRNVVGIARRNKQNNRMFFQ